MKEKVIFLWTAFLIVLLCCCYNLIWVGTALCVGLLCAFFTAVFFKKAVKTIFLFGLLGSVAAGCLFFLFESFFYDPVMKLADENASASGIVTRVEFAGDYNSIIMNIQKIKGRKTPLIGKMILYADPTIIPEIGDTVIFTGHIRSYEQHGSGFDSKNFYKAKGIYLKASAPASDISIQKGNRGLFYLLQKASDASAEQLYRVLSGNSYFLGKALILGDKSEMPDSMASLFAKGGMSHALAVSGMHISFFAMLISLFLRRMKIGYRTAQVMTACMIALFVLFIGCPLSATRAGLMAVMYFLGKALYKDGDSLVLLFTAVGFICISNPFAVMDIGLQLSFLSVLGILLVAVPMISRVNRRFPERKLGIQLFRYILSGLITTLCAVFFTLPVTAAVFGRISLVAPVTNLLALPVVFMLMTAAFIILVLGWIPVVGFAAAHFMKFFSEYIMGVLRIGTASRLSNISLSYSFILAGYLLCFAVFFFLAVLKSKKNLWMLPMTGFLIAAFAAGAIGIYVYTQVTTLSFLDVGQGECAILAERGRAVIIDCGSSSSKSAGKIAEAHLLHQGISEIETLILTHSHEDHGNGMIYLLKQFQVRQIILPKGDNSSLTSEIREIAAQKGILLLYLGDKMTFDFSTNTKISLCRLGATLKDENEAGIVAKIETKGKSALLTADISAMQEAFLVESGEISADILKAAHHGSDSSSSELFLQSVSPEYTVISCGTTFSFPTPETVERISHFCDNIFITKDIGTVIFQISDNNIKVANH